ncbi:IS200/IS605 family transposase [Mangrovibacterium marinum]|uniref:REP element-mobilizing transposase RayT n=1 Tax=Mangrovibacterium marinum TaxID=1639118 RepID=A0A2T5BXP6_9BACT|nr:IS200/IS605 family transposase [Mangrovibacterium marinum]PTN05309.1 REP element-mobilizing transposase RayT [Mangrovibacterium marinum]
MANTYTQLIVQIVFAVYGKQNLIAEKHRERLEKYICGTITNKKSKPLAIYCNPDHTHILVGINPSTSVSDLARDIKANSSRWINEERLVVGKFGWQEGFGAFSYSKSQIDAVAKYILNQAERHKHRSFKEEYLEILMKSEIEYDERYLFEWYD